MAKCIFRFCVPVFIAFILISSCAKISSPSGGPADRLPPVIVGSEPLNGASNFKSKKITIYFNEFVTLDKINEKFMVSPPMKKKPVISLKGKSIVIEYDEELRDSTTYTFYFQDAIRDLNESNVIDNYQFVISTGDVVDSLSVTGNVLEAFTLDPPEGALVMLYRDQSDSAVIKSLPDYISKATGTGYFRIDNLKEGKYRLYALIDADNSKNFNLPDEEIAFLSAPVEVTAEKNFIPAPPDSIRTKRAAGRTADTVVMQGEHKLILFKPEKKKHYLTSSPREMKYKLVYTLSLPPDTNKVSILIPQAAPGSYFTERSREGDTILVWITDSALYSTAEVTTIITHPFTDSLGKTISKEDTVLMRYLAPRSVRATPKGPAYRVTSGFANPFLRPGQEILFKSPTPFRDPDTSKIRLYEAGEKSNIRVPYSFRRDEENSCRMNFLASFSPEKSYLFIADSAAFGNIYGESADSTGTKFSFRSDDSFGRLKLNISNFEGHRIVQLLNNQDKVMRQVEMNSDGIHEFTQLDQATYKLRVIYDLNGDGKWNTGDFATGRQPEPVSFYSQELMVKENLWLEQDWDISEKNYKKLKIPAGTGFRNTTGR